MFPVSAEYHRVVVQGLDGIRGDDDWHFDFFRYQLGRDEHARKPIAFPVIQHDPGGGSAGLCANQRADIGNDTFAFGPGCGGSDSGGFPDPDHFQVFRINRDLRPHFRYVGYGENGRVFLERLALGYGFRSDESGNRGTDIVSGKVSPLVDRFGRHAQRMQFG